MRLQIVLNSSEDVREVSHIASILRIVVRDVCATKNVRELCLRETKTTANQEQPIVLVDLHSADALLVSVRDPVDG